MSEDCALILPGTRCNIGGTCTANAQCANESHCVLAPPSFPPGTPGRCYAPKTRYISIANNPFEMGNTAREISLIVGGIPIYPGWWVGTPVWIPPNPPSEPLGWWKAEVVFAPVFDNLTGGSPWPNVVHVTGCEITPGQTFGVEAWDTTLVWVSPRLDLNTNTTWGDTVGSCPGGVCAPADGVPGLSDIMAAISEFRGIDVAPTPWLDIAPSNGPADPDQVIGLGDIMGCIQGFQGVPYPGNGPLGFCP